MALFKRKKTEQVAVAPPALTEEELLDIEEAQINSYKPQVSEDEDDFENETEDSEEDLDEEAEKIKQKLKALESKKEKLAAEKVKQQTQQPPVSQDQVVQALSSLSGRLTQIEARLFRAGL